MSYKEVENALEEWRLNDELAEAPGFCRRSAIEMVKAARNADKTEPHVTVSTLAWPKADKGENVHYAVEISDSKDVKKSKIYNTVRTAGFPQYIGPRDTAPGKFKEMKKAKNVI